MGFSKITDIQLENRGILGLPDTPQFTSGEMKRKFDELPREVIIPAFNSNVESLLSESAADEIGAAPPLGITPEPQPEVGKPAKLSAVLKGIVTYVSAFVTGLCYSKAETNAEINKKMVEIGAGDMAKTIYDINNSGAVDNAERLGNELPEYFQPKTDGTLATENKTVAGAINEVRYSIPNANLLDNTDFAHPINQRNVSDTITATGYFIDRWKLLSGSVTLTANGLQLNGTMAQILEFAAGADTTARVGMYSGTANASYNNNDKTFTLTSSGGVIEWAKLEKSGVTTPYVPKGYGAELAECMRYYQILRLPISQHANIMYMMYNLPYSPMRILPTLKTERINWQHITAGYSALSKETVSHDIYGDAKATATGEILFRLSADL